MVRTSLVEEIVPMRFFRIRIEPREIGNRLFKIRYVAGYGQKGKQGYYAEEIVGIKSGSYSHYEIGKFEIPLIPALQVVESMPGLTLDYIYRDGFTMIPELTQRLRDAPDRALIMGDEDED